MSYRKIIVDNQTYFYTVGKSNVHIKGGKLTKPLNFSTEEFGDKYPMMCHCGCGEKLSDMYNINPKDCIQGTAITPSIIKRVILSH